MSKLVNMKVTEIVAAVAVSLALMSSALAGEPEDRNSFGATGYSKAWSQTCNSYVDTDHLQNLEPDSFPSQADLVDSTRFMRSNCDQYVQSYDRVRNQANVATVTK